MLRGIHTATRNWLGRLVTGVLLGLIAISFAIWGIGDIFRGFGRSTLAKIGSTEIGVEQFRQTYNDRVQQLIAPARPADPRRIRRARSGCTGNCSASCWPKPRSTRMSRGFGLNLPDDEIAQRITQRSEFPRHRPASSTAHVSTRIIRQAGYTEARYVAEQRTRCCGSKSSQTLVGGSIAPARPRSRRSTAIVNEARASIISCSAANRPATFRTPRPKQLAKYFEERKRCFARPNSASSMSSSL